MSQPWTNLCIFFSSSPLPLHSSPCHSLLSLSLTSYSTPPTLGLLPESYRDKAGLCRGLVQPGLCLQCSGTGWCKGSGSRDFWLLFLFMIRRTHLGPWQKGLIMFRWVKLRSVNHTAESDSAVCRNWHIIPYCTVIDKKKQGSTFGSINSYDNITYSAQFWDMAEWWRLRGIRCGVRVGFFYPKTRLGAVRVKIYIRSMAIW